MSRKWCYWIKNADRHTEEDLRELLPGLEFLQATRELSGIQAITEEKEMYDSREKALLDYESNLIDARQEGRQEGHQEGHQEGRQEGELIGMEIGRIQLLQELLELPLQNRKELAAMPLEEIVGLRKTLQSKLRDRNA
jgi:flagellar biosynthesis/type III secretory pathway protein FliH